MHNERLARASGDGRSRRAASFGRRAGVALVLLVALLSAAVDRAWAAPVRVEGLRIISGGGGALGACQLRDSKAEVSLAASPADPRRLTAAWIQTVRNADGGERPIDMWATSTDDGARWTSAQPVPGLTNCTGGQAQADGATDPFVSFGADGIAYLSSVVQEPLLPIPVPQRSAVYANRSGDGGLRWDAPVVVDQPLSGQGGVDDFAPVTADPRIPGRAYLVWGFVPASIMFSRTTDGGRSWSPGEVVEQSPPGRALDGARVVVMADSSLLLFYGDSLATGLETRSGQVALRVVRSSDGGRSWSAPADVAVIPFAAGPANGRAAAPDGNAYMAWADPGAGKVMVVRSADLGQSWSQPHQVASQPGAQDAALAVDPAGTLGITWYDNRNTGPGPNTDVWFAESHDHGATWSETHLAGPFDLSTATAVPRTGNPPLGDYQGLVATPDGFAAAFVMAKPQARNGPSDVFFAHIRLTGETTSPGSPGEQGGRRGGERCAGGVRSAVIRIPRRKGRVVKAAVFVNGKLVQRRRGHRLRNIRLRNLPSGKITVRVVARTARHRRNVIRRILRDACQRSKSPRKSRRRTRSRHRRQR